MRKRLISAKLECENVNMIASHFTKSIFQACKIANRQARSQILKLNIICRNVTGARVTVHKANMFNLS